MNYVSKNTDPVVLNIERFDDQTMAQVRVAHAIECLKVGRGVIVTDDADRENEGDFIFAAEHLTVEQMALMIREGSGIVCLVMTEALADHLDLPPMVRRTDQNTVPGSLCRSKQAWESPPAFQQWTVQQQ